MARLEFPKKVRAQIVARAMQANGALACEGCGTILGKKAFEVDHVVPEGLRDHTMKRAALTAEDGKLLGRCCHAPKTKADVQAIRKADRCRNFDTGVTRPKQTIQSQGFRKADRPTAMSAALPPLPPRNIYETRNEQ